MTKAISDFRVARSFIGNTATEESVELDFNIGTREAIEIAAVLGLMGATANTEATTVTPVIAEQSLHVEDGTIEALGSSAASNDAFDNDSEVIFAQVMNMITFNGTTEAAAAMDVNPSGLVTFPEPVISPINLTHRADNDGASLDVACTLLIYYRYVELSDQELAFQFARRRR